MLAALWLFSQTLGFVLPALSNAGGQEVQPCPEWGQSETGNHGYDAGLQSGPGYDAQLPSVATEGLGDPVAIVRTTPPYDSCSVSTIRTASAPRAPSDGKTGFIAAEETASLLPARSPWPGNSGFIEGTVERKFLMPGETIDRYGFGGGKFVSPAETLFEARALRAGTENLPFNTYQVVKPFEVNAGGVQPWFGQPGLGTQYELPVSVNTLLNRGISKPAP